MSEKSNIAWTSSTFNPWIGCTKVSPGCDGCYAEALDHRMQFGGATHWGAGVPRYRTKDSNWRKPLEWNKKAAASGAPWRVFCASLADVFDNEVPSEWRTDLWNLIDATPNLSWLLVTKRIANAHRMVPIHWYHREAFPPNVRILITVCNQEEADRDIPRLLAVPCKNGISYEPALGPVDWTPWLRDGVPSKEQIDCERGAHYLRHGSPRLDWIIVGGESAQAGHTARPFNHAWARSTIEQCKASGVPVFVKQLGALQIIESNGPAWARPFGSKDRAGADPAEWPESLCVMEFPK